MPSRLSPNAAMDANLPLELPARCKTSAFRGPSY